MQIFSYPFFANRTVIKDRNRKRNAHKHIHRHTCTAHGISTPKTELRLRKTDSDVAVMVTTEPWVRQQLDQIERYIQQNVTVPSEYSLQLAAGYKPRWQHPLMCVSAPRWCNIFKLNRVSSY